MKSTSRNETGSAFVELFILFGFAFFVFLFFTECSSDESVIKCVQLLGAVFKMIVVDYVGEKKHEQKHKQNKHRYGFKVNHCNKYNNCCKCKHVRNDQVYQPFVLEKLGLGEKLIFQFRTFFL